MTKPKVGKYWIGFDLGGTKMLATVFDDRFQKIGKDRRKTMGHEGVEAGLLRIASAIEAACDNANISVAELGGIGIGIPGPLDLDAGIIKETANLGWQNVAIKDYLEKKFGCSISIANDVDVGVFGEYRFGAGKGAHCLLVCFPERASEVDVFMKARYFVAVPDPVWRSGTCRLSSMVLAAVVDIMVVSKR